MKCCTNYCGVACIDGTCPIANTDERAERGYEIIRTCKECPHYEACEDCYFYDNCPMNTKIESEGKDE